VLVWGFAKSRVDVGVLFSGGGGSEAEVCILCCAVCSTFFATAATDRSAMECRRMVMASDVHGVFTWVAARV
jgi:hypothetical protein